ncbi:acyl-CoA dehydrogenase family protein [Acidiferrimicrobium sp. IK]|uniref:acyl-CoA dehydrogenase family protein n=1 Tax=Acidiferrimicrobium sp. IK TaxID=2871700 RepID=UPI0021CB5F0D|nr:acyl-CoA dehydrogenase family protein [Acidiferrimicrobium sp. IK]MCU4186368.1 acyl-CoA dehydrogenase family protein [Acidiferrimicrobium sp. IK]
MNPRYSAQAEAFRAEVRSFLDEHLPENWTGIGALTHDEAMAFTDRWRATLHQHGFLGLSWPKEYGGAGLSKVEQVVLVEEMARAGVPAMGPNDTFSVKMVGNTLLRWGTEAQKQRFLPRILSGEDRWCQGYSEPDAGSDLAGLRTRAVLDGDSWRIDGQKIWQTRAREANWIFLLVRTDPDAPKHKGLTLLLVPLDQPGVEVRPLRMMGGRADFNAVFFNAACTDADNVVGAVNDGWAVAQSLLGLERGDEAATNPVQFRAEWDRLVAMARESGVIGDPVLRDRLIDAYVRVETMRFLGYRILTGVLSTGVIGPEASISKLYWSEYHRDVTRLAVDVLGARAMVVEGRAPLRGYRADDPGAPNSTASWVGALYNGVADTIYAGTSEVQRGILAEKVLGLPREPPAPGSSR